VPEGMVRAELTGGMIKGVIMAEKGELMWAGARLCLVCHDST